MKRCIICMKEKVCNEFNREHVIPDALGGCGNDNIINAVCKECNSNLGSKVDAHLTAHPITNIVRNLMQIRGRNGVPNPLKGVSINYDNTPITGKIMTNKYGRIKSFKADHKIYELPSGHKMIIAPRKDIANFANSYLRKNNLPELSKEEIEEYTLEIINKKRPSIKNISLTEEEKNKYLVYISPSLLKIAYEACWLRLGDKYINDILAVNIRDFINQLISGNEEELIIPTSMKMELSINDLCKRSSVSFDSDNICLYIIINILGYIKAKILVSENIDKYDIYNSLNPIIC